MVSSQSHVSCAGRVGLLTWQRRPGATGRPRTWSLRSVRTIMIIFALLKSAFDILDEP
jgi:hypothetical protein